MVKVLAEFYSPFEERLKAADQKIKVECHRKRYGDLSLNAARPWFISTGGMGASSLSRFPSAAIQKHQSRYRKMPARRRRLVERRSKKGRTFYGCDNYPGADLLCGISRQRKSAPCGGY